MSIPLNVAIVIVFMGLGLLEFRRLRRKDPEVRPETVHRVARYLVPLTIVVMALVGGLMALNVSLRLHTRLPGWWQLRNSAMVWAGLLAMIGYLFSVCLASAYGSGHRERHKISAITVLLIGALFYTQWRYHAPIADGLGSWIDADGVVQQSHDSSCAAASGANVARHFGIPKTEAEMARLMGTSRSGTLPIQVRLGLESLGLECELLQYEDGAPFRVEAPAILFIDHPKVGPEGHAVAYMGRQGDSIEIWDPLVGKQRFPEEEVHEFWHGHGVACRRPD